MDGLSEEDLHWLRSLQRQAQQAQERLEAAAEGIMRGRGVDPNTHEINPQTGAIVPAQENGQPKMETE